MFSLEIKRLRGILSMGSNEEEEDRLFSLMPADRARGNGHKLKHRKRCLNIRKNLFIVRVVRHWIMLPREVMEASFLKIFKAKLDIVLSYLQ